MFPLATAAAASKPTAGRDGGARALLERAPSLAEDAERVVASVVKSLQKMAGTLTTIDGALTGLALLPAKDVLAAHRPEAAAAAIECLEANCVMLATLDATLVHAMVELLCGGKGAEPPPVTLRPVTSIDQQFAQIVFTLAAGAIQAEWARHGFGKARAVKIEGLPASDLIGPRNQDVAVVRTNIGAFGLHGVFQLVLPQAALDRFRPAESEADRPDAADPLWSSLLQKEIGQASVTLDAYLEAKDVTLAALADLRLGQILPLPAEARGRAALVSDGRVLYRGEIGQAANRYSLRIDEIVLEPTMGAPTAPPARRRSPFDLPKA